MIWRWENINVGEFVRKFSWKRYLKYVISSYFRQKYYVEGPKLSNFKIRDQFYKMMKIEGPKLEKKMTISKIGTKELLCLQRQ